jgi:DNA invertase Pin-like site-specific DNA recombinase
MIAAYLRVSSRSQSLTTQRDAIERAAKARGDVIVQWYEEKRSGGTLDRPTLAHVRDLVRRGAIGRLYVFRIDRLTRSGIRDTLTLLEELRGAGCAVVSVADGFDLEGPARDVVLAVVSWAAQMERLALGERIAAARARVEKAGGRWGRPRRVTELVEQQIRARARAKKQSIRELAVAFKVPRSTVAAVLSGKGAYATPRARAQKRAPKKT